MGASPLATAPRASAGSWYAGAVADVYGQGLVIDFDETEGVPAEEDPLSAHRVPYDFVRPVPPATPAGFAKMLELGLSLELWAEGGWWEVELLGVSGGGWADPLPFDSSKELGAGSRVRVNKKDSEFDSMFGEVSHCSDGWLRVEFDGTGGRKNFRAGDLLLMTVDAAATHTSAAAAPATAETEATYSVRLMTAMAEEEGLYPVPISALRPGWCWRAGKWSGRWKEQPHKGHDEKEAAFSALQLAWGVGTHVEVLQGEKGMQGSWFEAEVTDHQFPDKCVVRYFQLHEGDDDDDAAGEERGPDWWPPLYVAPESWKLLRPLPPASSPESHDAWAAGLSPGAAADLYYDGGWWEVEVMELLPSAPATPAATSAIAAEEGGGGTPGPSSGGGGVVYLVKSVQFEAEHRVGAAELRPPHVWEAEAGSWGAGGSWGLRPPPEVHYTGGTAHKPKATGRSPRGGAKKAAKAATGEPREKPSSFALGTRRRGVDGAMWEVGYARADSRAEGWVPVPDGAAPASTFVTEPAIARGGGRAGGRGGGRGRGRQKAKAANAAVEEATPEPLQAPQAPLPAETLLAGGAADEVAPPEAVILTGMAVEPLEVLPEVPPEVLLLPEHVPDAPDQVASRQSV